VGKGKEMISAEGSLTNEEEAGERPLSDRYLRRTVSCVNEDVEKLQTFIIKEEDQRSFMIIGGVEIFLESG
jgi:hypothetical protein